MWLPLIPLTTLDPTGILCEEGVSDRIEEQNFSSATAAAAAVLLAVVSCIVYGLTI